MNSRDQDQISSKYQQALDLFNQTNFLAASNKSIEVIQLDPNHANGHMLQGKCYAQLGRWQEALAEYNRAIALAPGCASFYFYRGIAHSVFGNYQEAIRDMRTYFAGQPSDT